MGKIITNEIIADRLYDKFGDNISLADNYAGRKIKIKFICKKHGEFYNKPQNVLQNKYGCIKCLEEEYNEIKEEENKKISDIIQNMCTDDDYYEIIEYADRYTRVKIRHTMKNGYYHDFKTFTKNIFSGNWKCACQKKLNRLVMGVNDIRTIMGEDFYNCLVDKSANERVHVSSKEKVEVRCPECGNVFEQSMFNFRYTKFTCPYCSDGVSYPNKFILNFIKQCKEVQYYKPEYSPEWANYYYDDKYKTCKYDMYFVVNDKEYIIEMDGAFHFNAVYKKGLSIEEVNYIDNAKDRLATSHNIEIIRIDCNYSDNDNHLEYIKTNIEKSNLSKILDLSNIDYDCIHINSCKSRIVSACKLWNDGYEMNQIMKELDVSAFALKCYLKTGKQIGICDYEPGMGYKRSKYTPVVCMETKIVYDSIKIAADCTDSNKTEIGKFMRGQRNVGIPSKKDGVRYSWIYLNDYKEKYGEDGLIYPSSSIFKREKEVA